MDVETCAELLLAETAHPEDNRHSSSAAVIKIFAKGMLQALLTLFP